MSKDILETRQYNDAIEYTKKILKMSSSIEEIIKNSNEHNEVIEKDFKKNK